MTTSIPFAKFSGSGNDFILIDNRTSLVPETAFSEFARTVCERRLSVGADGLVLVEESDAADFTWRFFNSDGSRAEMCGNASRCVARFAAETGISGNSLSFETDIGVIRADVNGRRVAIDVPDPGPLETDVQVEIDGQAVLLDFVNTGVPHAVIRVDDAGAADMVGVGRAVRFHERFAPAGTNVNYMSERPDRSIRVRTYERGVEDETLACGTGFIACALVSAERSGFPSPVAVHASSGEVLFVHFKQKAGGGFTNVRYEGDVTLVYRGELTPEAVR